MLADPNRKLTNEEKKEALNASQTIRDYIAELEEDPTVGIIRDDPLNLRDFGALSRLLSLKGDKFTAFVSGAVDALPVTDNTVNAPIMSVVHDPQLQSYLFQQQTPFEMSRNSNPGWYTAGSLFSTTAFMVTGSEALGAMGIASGVLKNAILMGGFNAANSIADGEPADKVIFDTISGSLGGALGGTFSEAIGGSFTKALIDKGLSDQSIKLIASVPSGLSFGTMTTAVEESKNALYYGKDYKPDANNILFNIGFSTLFGTLEALKSVPGAAKIQSDYILGKPGAEQRAIEFINEQAAKLQSQPASPQTNPDMLPEMPPSSDTVAEQYINQWPGSGKGSTGVESPNAKGYTGNWDSFFEEPTNVAGEVFKLTPELENHIIYIDPLVPRNRGIGGAHNSEEFFKNDVQIIKVIQSQEIPGVTFYQYNMPLLGKDGWPVGGYGVTIFEKTIYDPSVLSNYEYLRRGLEAAHDSFRRNGVLEEYWEGYDSQGIKWIGFEENGVPKSFYPYIPKQ